MFWQFKMIPKSINQIYMKDTRDVNILSCEMEGSRFLDHLKFQNLSDKNIVLRLVERRT
jgi:hypothetical protein